MWSYWMRFLYALQRFAVSPFLNCLSWVALQLNVYVCVLFFSSVIKWVINLSSQWKQKSITLLCPLRYCLRFPIKTSFTWFSNSVKMPENCFLLCSSQCRNDCILMLISSQFHVESVSMEKHKLSSPELGSLTASTVGLWGAAIRLCISPLFVLLPTKVIMSLRTAFLPAFREELQSLSLAYVAVQLKIKHHNLIIYCPLAIITAFYLVKMEIIEIIEM